MRVLNKGRKVVIYSTCFVNFNKKNTGVAALKVLKKNGVEVQEAYPGCCGMPFLEQADLQKVVEQAKKVSKDLLIIIFISLVSSLLLWKAIVLFIVLFQYLMAAILKIGRHFGKWLQILLFGQEKHREIYFIGFLAPEKVCLALKTNLYVIKKRRYRRIPVFWRAF